MRKAFWVFGALIALALASPTPAKNPKDDGDSMKPESWRDSWRVAWMTALLTAFLTTGTSVIFHAWDARQKEKWTAYEHKEARYHELIRSLRTLQTDVRLQDPVEANKKFLEQVDLCLMYCSDEVIRSTWGLIDRSKPQNAKVYGVDTGTGALKGILYAIRKDMFTEVGMKTNINPEEIYLTSLSLVEIKTGSVRK